MQDCVWGFVFLAASAHLFARCLASLAEYYDELSDRKVVVACVIFSALNATGRAGSGLDL